MEIITAVIYRPGQRGEIIKIEPTLEKLQELVGGYVQVIRIAPESREETKILQDVGAAMKQSIGEEEENNGQ